MMISDEREIERRSVLMRLWRSRELGDAYYPERFVNGVGAEMEAEGLIERVDGGWRITREGIRQYALMGYTIQPREQQYFMFGKLRQEGIIKMLDRVQLEILERLEKAGGWMPATEFRATHLDWAANNAYVMRDGDQVKINKLGREALQDHRREMGEDVSAEDRPLTAHMQQALRYIWQEGGGGVRLPQSMTGVIAKNLMRRGLIQGSNKNGGYALTERGAEIAQALPEYVPKAAAACGECADCIHREVVALLRAHYPEIERLAELLEQQREIARQVDDAAKAPGVKS